MITVVAKAFDGPDGTIPSGTVVDSSDWRNEARLINSRFLRAASEEEAAEFHALEKTVSSIGKPALKKTTTTAQKKTGAKVKAKAKKKNP